MVEPGQLRRWSSDGRLMLVLEPSSHPRLGWIEHGWIVLDVGSGEEPYFEPENAIEHFSTLCNTDDGVV